MTDPKW